MKPLPTAFAAAALVSVSAPLEAAEAVFSADGTRIFYAVTEPGRIGEVNTEAGKATVLDLRKIIGETEVTGLTRSNSGNIVFAAGRTLWAMNPVKKEPVKVADTPDAETRFLDPACNPQTGDILITGRKGKIGESEENPEFILRKGEKTVKGFFARRVDRIGASAFSEEGHYYFGDPFDLWAGTVSREPISDEMGGALAGFRYAPLATLQTDEGNMSPQICEAIAPAGGAVYVALVNRYGGNILKLPAAPVSDEADENALHDEPQDRIKVTLAALQGVKFLGECASHRSLLCAAPDGKSIAFLTSGDGDGLRKFVLLKNDREATVLATLTREQQ